MDKEYMRAEICIRTGENSYESIREDDLKEGDVFAVVGIEENYSKEIMNLYYINAIEKIDNSYGMLLTDIPVETPFGEEHKVEMCFENSLVMEVKEAEEYQLEMDLKN